MLCSRCSTSLPDGSQFCLKCGQKVEFTPNSVALATVPTQSVCSKCGTIVPQSAEFCQNCGQPVISTANRMTLAPVSASEIAALPPWPARRQRRVVPLLLLVLVLLGAVLWALTSKGPAAQQVQEFVHWSQEQTIIDSSISVNPHSFSPHMFTVPPGALDVSVNGEFSALATSPHNRSGNVNESVKDHDPGIEAYVLSDEAFTVWSTGYAAQSQYESGPVAGSTINAPLPLGAGVYYVVFSNKNSPRAKTVHAVVTLQYKSWLPGTIVRMKERLWNWLGL